MVGKDEVTGWLDDLDVVHEDVEHQNLEGSFTWAILVHGTPFKLLVAHPTTQANHLVMELSLTLSEDDRTTLAGLDELQRDRFILDLRMDLLRTFVGAEFEMDANGEPNVISRMTFGLNLFEDPLQRAIFFRRMHRLQSAALLGGMWIKRLSQFGTTG